MEPDIEDAIQALAPDGSVVVGWVLVAVIQGPDEAQGEAFYRLACPPSQMHHSTIGLLYHGVDVLCSGDEDGE